MSTILSPPPLVVFFFFNDTATTEIYTLSLHDALPISEQPRYPRSAAPPSSRKLPAPRAPSTAWWAARWRISKQSARRSMRSEEHTSELQSRLHLVCRLLLEKKKKIHHTLNTRRVGSAPWSCETN